MDNMAYLQQISGSSSRQANRAKGISGLFSDKKIIILIGLALLAIIIIIVGSIMGGEKENPELAAVTRLDQRMTNLSKTISTYNKQVKSSELRAIGTTLSGILNNTDRDITALLKSDFKAETDMEKNTVKTVQAEEAAHIADVNEKLKTGRMSGLLDRVYEREITLQVALLISLETETAGETENQTLLSVISSSLESLNNIHTQLKEFSDSGI